MNVKKIQKALKLKGFDPGKIDGVMGPKTEKAIVDFKKSVGLAARPYIGPITIEKLFGDRVKDFKQTGLPWMNEISKYMGMHEVRNFKRLFAWLRSDKSSVGDPRKYPWCGDAIETAIKLTLPNEVFSGAVKRNPYLARNWLSFGVKTPIRYGAVGVFWRGKLSGISGHVAFVIGYDPKRRRIRIRGGNQSNRISNTWISESRVLGYRKPKSWKKELPPVPIMNSRGAIISTNEY